LAPFIIPNIQGYIIAKKGTIESYELEEKQDWNYIWEVENGIIVAGQGTRAINIKWNNADKGTITVRVTNGLGCMDDNTLTITLFDDCMLVYPNPASTETTVFLPFYDNSKNLELFDSKGSKVYTAFAQKNNTVDVSYLAQGIYIFRYENCKIKLLKD